MNECLFCKIIDGQIPSKKIYENEYTLCFLDVFPNSDGHCLVIPKKHFENFETTDSLYITEVAKTKQEVVKLLRANLPVEPVGFNYVSNQGSEAFQTVFHYHEHIIPKYIKEFGYGFVINHANDMTDQDEIHKILTKK
ncbi:histidine triad protein [Spiroplasma chinense]|uniref:Histidine triad protein n=1 Tax=Spiroplasma chinense TaxID=216932 RepID=A0A5B9Y5Q9_9MOLU|nr:HIT family protein [Spiroplasma chinense]QEH62143.1 histidine triad protein [Spiroplasma chinense]